MCSDTPRRWSIGGHEIHLWFALLDDRSQEGAGVTFAQLLDTGETERASRFRFERDRKLFVAAHGLTRILLSAYLGIDPRDLSFSVGQLGRPKATRSVARGLQFNLSHSDAAMMLGVTLHSKLGVDIERVRICPALLDVANHAFTRQEADWITTARPNERLDRFFTIWTLKEAYLKARGLGLNLPLNEVEIAPGRQGATLSIAHHLDSHSRDWLLRHARVFTNYKCAMAVSDARANRIIAREVTCTDEVRGSIDGWVLQRHPVAMTSYSIWARQVALEGDFASK